MSDGSAVKHLEAGCFKHADQFVDVLPKKALEEPRVHALIAALHCFDDE